MTSSPRAPATQQTKPRFQRGLYTLLLPCLVLALVSAWLRFRDLGLSPLWLDEAYSVLVAKLAVPQVVAKLQQDVHPPAYFLLLHAWVKCFGSSEAAVRSTSALSGALLPAALYLGARLDSASGQDGGLGRRAISLVILAPAIMAVVSPIALHYSQECRMYALASLLTVFSMICVIQTCHSGNARLWQAALFLSLTALLYTHNFGLFVLVGCCGYCLLALRAEPKRGGAWRALLATAAAVLAFVPWLAVLARQSAGHGSDWIAEVWSQESPLLVLPASFAACTIDPAYPYYLVKLSNIHQALPPILSATQLGWAGVLLSLFLFALGTYRACRSRGSSLARLSLAILACTWGLPILYSLLARPIFIVGRYDVIGIGPLLIVLGQGLVELSVLARTKLAAVLAPACLVIWLTIAGLFSWAYLQFGMVSSERNAVAWYKAASASQDLVIIPGLPVVVSAYYWERLDCRARLVPFPIDLGPTPGWVDDETLTADSMRLTESLNLLRNYISGHAANGTRSYLTFFPAYSPRLRQALLYDLSVYLGPYRAVSTPAELGDLEIFVFPEWPHSSQTSGTIR